MTELERFVNDGGGLMIFCGELMDITAYNERLYRDGNGLLPAKLDGAVGWAGDGIGRRAVAEFAAGSLAKAHAGGADADQDQPLHGVENVKENENVRVLARWNNSQSAPAVIEKRFGRGRVLLFTVTADKAWSDWPVDATFVLATRSAAKSIARGSSLQENISAGQPIQLTLPPERIGNRSEDAQSQRRIRSRMQFVARNGSTLRRR